MVRHSLEEAAHAPRDRAVALTVYDDPRATALRLRDLHSRWQESEHVPTGVRPVIATAWSRQRPRPSVPAAEPLAPDLVAARRERAGALRQVLPLLQATLLAVAEEAGNELVVCDADGVVLWLSGPREVRRSSERLGFVEGACWSEGAVGTNGLGTALVDARPIQVFGPEHSDAGHHAWVCTGAPIIDPATGRPLGAMTLSGPLRTAHPNTLALIRGAAGLAESTLAIEHQRGLHRLRAAAEALPTGRGAWLVVDDDGWVAAAHRVQAGERVRIPTGVRPGPTWVPSLGVVTVDRLAPGWVLWLEGSQDVTLVVRAAPTPTVTVRHGSRAEVVPVTARQFAILTALADHPHGLTGDELVALAYDEPVSAVTVRAEVSRLRRRLGPIIATRPYRLLAACLPAPSPQR